MRNGALRDFGNHTVSLAVRNVSTRLFLIEAVAIDDATGAVLATIATFRAAES